MQAIMGSLVRNGIQSADKISVYDISIENAQFCNKNFGVSMWVFASPVLVRIFGR